jgi:hypothetical protein
MIGYLRYLADRYNEFKRWECEQRGQKMAHGFIYTAYKRELKYDLRNTPVDRFEAVAYRDIVPQPLMEHLQP